jgi:hypothetical protein
MRPTSTLWASWLQRHACRLSVMMRSLLFRLVAPWRQ